MHTIHFSMAIEGAYAVARSLHDDTLFKRVAFEDFGKDKIKANLRVHPDTYVQICLQLTYMRMHGKPGKV